MSIYGAIPRGGYKQQTKGTPRSLGFARYTLGFDGVDDLVSIKEIPATSIKTIMIRAKLKRHAMAKGSYNFLTSNIYQHTANNFFYIWGTWDYFHWVPGLNTWYSLVFIFPNAMNDTTGARLIYNDKFAPSIVHQGTSRNGFALSSISTPDANKGWDGLIAEVLVYNRELGMNEIQYIMLNYHDPVRDGLVLWLPMEEGTGETVYDKSGSNNHGTLLPTGTGPTWERLRQWELRAATK